MCRHEPRMKEKCEQPLEMMPWRVGCGGLSCVLLLFAPPWILVCRPHRDQAVPLCFLASELRPQPLSPCWGQTPMQYYLSIVGTLWSINTQSFPYIKCFVLTSLEEVRHILEPRKWSTEKRKWLAQWFACPRVKRFWNRFPKFPNYILKYYGGWVTRLDLVVWWRGSSYGQLLTICAFPIQFNFSKARRTFPWKHIESINVKCSPIKKNIKITILFWMG